MDVEALAEEQEAVADALEEALSAVGCPVEIHVSGRGFRIGPGGECRLIAWAAKRAGA
ncbi:hypothetical protein [Kitasatospora sp. NPDC057198]|uniref:hypothetical protein n=1 Tax=Kitasatospora sp. NPDC057198 TaxID=3346046 RepID=UPI00363A09CD